MKKFVVLYYSPTEAMAKMQSSTPEEMQEGQKKWMDWFAEQGDDLLDMGEFFMQGRRITAAGSEDSTGAVTGYSIIQAESIDDAEKRLADHPHIEWFEGCSVEVYEPMIHGK